MSGGFIKYKDGEMIWAASDPGFADVSANAAVNAERAEKAAARRKEMSAHVADHGSFELGGVVFYPTADGAVGMRPAGRTLAEIVMDNGRPGSPKPETYD